MYVRSFVRLIITECLFNTACSRLIFNWLFFLLLLLLLLILMLLCICLHCFSTVCMICTRYTSISRCSTFISFDVRIVINIKFFKWDTFSTQKTGGREKRGWEVNIVSIAWWFYAACFVKHHTLYVSLFEAMWQCKRSPRRETSHCERDFATWQPHVESSIFETIYMKMKNITSAWVGLISFSQLYWFFVCASSVWKVYLKIFCFFFNKLRKLWPLHNVII